MVRGLKMGLREIRRDCGMTQKELTERTGINTRQIQKYESGEYDFRNMTVNNFRALSEALGCSMDDLANRWEKGKMKYRRIVEIAYWERDKGFWYNQTLIDDTEDDDPENFDWSWWEKEELKEEGDDLKITVKYFSEDCEDIEGEPIACFETWQSEI